MISAKVFTDDINAIFYILKSIIIDKQVGDFKIDIIYILYASYVL